MSTTTRPSPPDPASREAARRLRVEAIMSGAIVRASLGITATYCRLDDGRHQVAIRGRTATAGTLQGAIDQARAQTEAEGGPDA